MNTIICTTLHIHRQHTIIIHIIHITNHHHVQGIQVVILVKISQTILHYITLNLIITPKISPNTKSTTTIHTILHH